MCRRNNGGVSSGTPLRFSAILPLITAGSSNGRTGAFEALYLGSNPSPATRSEAQLRRAWIRTRGGSEGEPPGPLRVGSYSKPRVSKAQPSIRRAVRFQAR